MMAERKEVRFFRQADITARYDISDRYLRYLRSAGEFPQPDMTLGKGRVKLWAEATVLAWEESQQKLKPRKAAAAR
jgi:hypothetical protein